MRRTITPPTDTAGYVRFIEGAVHYLDNRLHSPERATWDFAYANGVRFARNLREWQRG